MKYLKPAKECFLYSFQYKLRAIYLYNGHNLGELSVS